MVYEDRHLFLGKAKMTCFIKILIILNLIFVGVNFQRTPGV